MVPDIAGSCFWLCNTQCAEREAILHVFGNWPCLTQQGPREGQECPSGSPMSCTDTEPCAGHSTEQSHAMGLAGRRVLLACPGGHVSGQRPAEEARGLPLTCTHGSPALGGPGWEVLPSRASVCPHADKASRVCCPPLP